MKEKKSALFSKYVLDGVPQELSPAQLLDGCLPPTRTPSPSDREEDWEEIADETRDAPLSPLRADDGKADEYLKAVKDLGHRGYSHAFSAEYTKARIACALIDALWRKGRFSLQDIAPRLSWKWDCAPIGNMASFYASAQAAAEYIDALGLTLGGYSFRPSKVSSLDVQAALSRQAGSPQMDDGLEEDCGRKGRGPSMSRFLKCPDTAIPNPTDWVVYVPFESCDYRLGGSLFWEATGIKGDVAPAMDDPDYFIDCYEVVRELIEDGIVTAGRTVGEGGLATALDAFIGQRLSLDCDLSDMARATGEKSLTRLLFAEVPGVLLQIHDIDYDYVDAELLLQDVTWFTLAQVGYRHGGVHVGMSGKGGISGILESLLRSETSEGED